jgi:hypothetical protein
MKKITFVLSLFLIGCSKFGQISSKIDINNRTKKPFVSYHSIRMDLYKKGQLNFLNLENDTLILKQDWQIQSLVNDGFIIANNGKLCYSYNKIDDKFEFNKFGCEIDKAIQKWDTLALKSNEAKGSLNAFENTSNLTRVILKEGKILKVERLSYIPPLFNK